MNKNLWMAFCTTSLSFCTLYTPQPLLPLLAEEFGVSPTDSALLITVTLAPLGLAPIVYGYFLQAIPARSMLRAAVLLLIANQFAFFFATEFWHLIALRVVQGLLLPAIFTALMTYCASMAPAGEVRRVMGWYVGATIFGGFASRVVSGVLSDLLGWHWVFVVLGLSLVPVWLMLRRIDADAEINFQRLDLHSIRRVLANPLYRRSYTVIFGVFFVFAAVLNLLPFRIRDIAPDITPSEISFLYTGYLIGIPAAIVAARIVSAFGAVNRAVSAGLIAVALGALAYTVPNQLFLFATMFVFAGGMFFVHSVLSGMLNARATEHKGVVNGLYVTAYYVSGALGTWLPGYVYLRFDWDTVMWIFAVVVVGLAVFARRI